MDEIMRTVIPEGSGFGGGSALALGAGAIGGLVLGSDRVLAVVLL